MITHCFHKTGMGTTHGFGGSEQHCCCWCGKFVSFGWEIEQRTLLGHGPNFKRKYKAELPIPDEECEGREC